MIQGSCLHISDFQKEIVQMKLLISLHMPMLISSWVVDIIGYIGKTILLRQLNQIALWSMQFSKGGSLQIVLNMVINTYFFSFLTKMYQSV